MNLFGISVLVDASLPPDSWRLLPSEDVMKLYDIGICPKCWEVYVVSKWPHRCQPGSGR